MGMKLDSKTGVYHYTTDGGFHIALVAEGAMDTACKLKDDRIKELDGRNKALIIHARHFESCKSNVAIFGKAEHYPCDCGLDNLLNRGK